MGEKEQTEVCKEKRKSEERRMRNKEKGRTKNGKNNEAWKREYLSMERKNRIIER